MVLALAASQPPFLLLSSDYVSHPQEVSSNSMNASGSLLSSGLYECYSHSLDTLSPSILPWMIPTDFKVSPLRPLALE